MIALHTKAEIIHFGQGCSARIWESVTNGKWAWKGNFDAPQHRPYDAITAPTRKAIIKLARKHYHTWLALHPEAIMRTMLDGD